MIINYEIFYEMDDIIISNKRDHDSQVDKKNRIKELKELKIDDLKEIIEKYKITKIYEWNPTRTALIDGIILYEKISLGGKQTELKINIDNKIQSYFIKTSHNLILVKKIKNINDNIDTYGVYRYPFTQNILSTRTILIKKKNNDKTQFRFKDCPCKNLQSLINDLEMCHKAINFIESLYFFLKIRYLLCLFNNNNDIIRNICFIYFERILQNVSNIRCKLQ